MMVQDTKKLERLIVGLINAVRQKGGSVSKTRLLKLIYLADIAYYRTHAETFTGFHWLFHLYGPWTHEYDALLSEMESKSVIKIVPWSHPEGEAQLIQTEERAGTEGLFESLEAEFELNRHIENFGTKPLGELLNFVYFETEPMQGAERGSVLDFAKVDRTQKIRPYKRSSSPQIDRKAISALREKLTPRETPSEEGFIPPRYDQEYFEMMRELETKD